MVGKVNREDHNQTASSLFCLELFCRQLVFEILEHSPYKSYICFNLAKPGDYIHQQKSFDQELNKILWHSGWSLIKDRLSSVHQQKSRKKVGIKIWKK